MLVLRGAPRGLDVAAVHLARDRSELLLHVAQLAQRDREQAIRGERDPFFELEFLLELVAAKTERRFRARREVGFEVVDVRFRRG